MVSIYGGGRLVFASTFNQTYYYNSGLTDYIWNAGDYNLF